MGVLDVVLSRSVHNAKTMDFHVLPFEAPKCATSNFLSRTNSLGLQSHALSSSICIDDTMDSKSFLTITFFNYFNRTFPNVLIYWTTKAISMKRAKNCLRSHDFCMIS